ncbi:hypothetical protein HNQ85_001683 [Anoxybacillus calidus]|uniref:DUF2975 domain-containing protein n=1 Tax=[Anoxybacillus] calidus TaxID=575178 RepID=A0A7V9YZQ6_9BACL|nr:hypothetical protein [Anoxybacillus calidus]
MKSITVVKVLNLLVMVFLVLMAITFVKLPMLVNKYGEMTGMDLTHLFWIKLFLYLTAIPFTFLLVMAKKLCKNILQNNPFSPSSIKSLYIISICAFIDFFLYLIGTFIFKNLLSLTLMIAAFMVGMVGLVLSHLAKLALEIKEENDLTI